PFSVPQATPDSTSTSDVLTTVEPLSVGDLVGTLVDKLAGWVEGFVLLLPNLVAALLVVLAFVLLARSARSLVTTLMNKISGRASGASTSVVSLLGTLAYSAVLAAGIFIALGLIGLDRAVTTLLAGAGVLGLALGFAFQDIAANFIAGVLIAVRSPFDLGDLVETNGHMGTISDINLRATHVRTFQGQEVIIPNSQVYQNPLVNYTEIGSRRIDLGCGVGYGDDLQHAEDVATAALSDVSTRDTARDVTLFWTEFGDSSVNFVASYWVTFQGQADFLAAQSEGIKRLKTAFDASGVTIPFPIRTLDFGPNGGVELREMLDDKA
ncbi:MAG: mechanosensitive ion channel family protein, partial [Bacteroidota bacterium]